ncbi:MAG: hypothetical protein DLM68_08065 [Hyphomicrobiales bacterium]|nr:MAG: hypothetical protein DLM68_08065 [Hyphomicrobiales bacterium]
MRVGLNIPIIIPTSTPPSVARITATKGLRSIVFSRSALAPATDLALCLPYRKSFARHYRPRRRQCFLLRRHGSEGAVAICVGIDFGVTLRRAVAFDLALPFLGAALLGFRDFSMESVDIVLGSLGSRRRN